MVGQNSGEENISVSMNDHLEHYHNGNEVSRKDALETLIEYGPRLKFKPNARVIEVGCADGAVSNILYQRLPNDIQLLLCCDKNEKALQFAQERYPNDKIKYRVLNIEEKLPEDLRGRFDNFFSLMTFHWVTQQEKAFQNVYDLLTEGGECFLTLKGYSKIYQMFVTLARNKKWGPYMTNMKPSLSPYYEISSPDLKIKELLNNIGFKNVHVKSRQKVFMFDKLETFRSLLTGVNPFVIPEALTKTYFDDLVEVARSLGMINDETGNVAFLLNMNLVHATK